MYDNTCKFLAANFSQDLAQWLIGEAVELTELKPTELSLEPIRADSIIFLESDDLVLHIEFQTGVLIIGHFLCEDGIAPPFKGGVGGDKTRAYLSPLTA